MQFCGKVCSMKNFVKCLIVLFVAFLATSVNVEYNKNVYTEYVNSSRVEVIGHYPFRTYSPCKVDGERATIQSGDFIHIWSLETLDNVHVMRDSDRYKVMGKYFRVNSYWFMFGVYLLIALAMWGVYEIRHKLRYALTGLCVGLGMCTFILPFFLGAIIGFNALFPKEYAGTWVGLLVGISVLGLMVFVIYSLIALGDVVLKYILRYSVRMWCIIIALPMITVTLPMCIYNWLRGNGFRYGIVGCDWYVDGIDNAWSFVSEE